MHEVGEPDEHGLHRGLRRAVGSRVGERVEVHRDIATPVRESRDVLRLEPEEPSEGRGGQRLRELTDDVHLATVHERGERCTDPIVDHRFDAWHALTLPHAPTMRAHAYSLLRTILGTATERRLIPSNPAKIRGAGNVDRAHKVESPPRSTSCRSSWSTCPNGTSSW